MDVTRLSGVALASALMFACAGQMAPGDAASVPDRDDAPPPAAIERVRPEEGEGTRG